MRLPGDIGLGMEFGKVSSRFHIPGDVIIATGMVDQDLISRVLQAPRPLLVLNRELGFDEVDCAVLRDVGERLVGLEVTGSFRDDTDVHWCSNLQELNLNSDCRGGVDWTGLGSLSHLFVYADRLSETFPSLGKLQFLQVYGASDEQAGFASSLPGLEDLTLISSRIRTIESITGLRESLTSLSIRQASALQDFSGLSRFRLLRRLLLESCRHLSSLEFVSNMPDLEVLSVSDCGSIQSLRPLEGCLRLERLHFYGSTNVQDGDLSVLGLLPDLRGAYFQRRRHYRAVPGRFPTMDD